MKTTILIISIVLISVLFISGCVTQYSSKYSPIVDECVNVCNSIKNTTNISSGPCIGNPMMVNRDWVCDVVHSPRQDVDNLQENQCSAFGNKTASHFVEVNEQCIPISVDGYEIK
jgi:hypothetical protein